MFLSRAWKNNSWLIMRYHATNCLTNLGQVFGEVEVEIDGSLSRTVCSGGKWQHQISVVLAQTSLSLFKARAHARLLLLLGHLHRTSCSSNNLINFILPVQSRIATFGARCVHDPYVCVTTLITWRFLENKTYQQGIGTCKTCLIEGVSVNCTTEV